MLAAQRDWFRAGEAWGELASTVSNTVSIWDSTTGAHLTSMRNIDLESVIWHPGSRALFAGGRGVLGYEFMA
ncbi:MULTISPECIES: hypothetical protein [Streptomyces griseus group]|uniref:hypothetical protein n=1 Tax=Streptomyces griseus group TaxID=629295 RepID=UPI002E1286CF|nr:MULTISPECIES: hypothetical protein [Streptomyces griseus group]WSI46073.1 hypothetical protein OG366_00390 [Streptomyces cyaneofuscatus]WSI52674.1 hypothetical protein OG366_36775 [Streptomyces cyaneofuscatus]